MEINEGAFVLGKFAGKKRNSDFHYVGRVIDVVRNGEVSIKYFRRDYNVTVGRYSYFKEPREEDIYHTNVSDIVKSLPKPLIIKQRLCFDASEMSGLVVR